MCWGVLNSFNKVLSWKYFHLEVTETSTNPAIMQHNVALCTRQNNSICILNISIRTLFCIEL